MRAGRAIGVALAVLVAAAVATAWMTPAAAAAGQQASTGNQQADKKVEKKIEQKVTVTRQKDGGPAIVTVEENNDGQKKVTTHTLVGEPMIAALAGGGPRLGVEIRDITPEDVTKLKLAGPNGVIVENVTKESAAEKAGVKAGDVVVQYDGENVRSAQQFTRLVRETVAGRPVKVAVLRDGKRVELTAAPAMASGTIGLAIDDQKVQELEKQLGDAGDVMRQFRFQRRVPAPNAPSTPMPPGGRMFQWRQQVPTPMPVPEGDILQWFGEPGTGNLFFQAGRGRLGVTVQELTPELAGYFGVKDGLLVNSVEADSPAARAGIKAGDVIGSLDGKAVTTTAELVKGLADKDGEVTVGVTRDKKALTLKATLEERKPLLRRRAVPGRPA